MNILALATHEEFESCRHFIAYYNVGNLHSELHSVVCVERTSNDCMMQINLAQVNEKF